MDRLNRLNPFVALVAAPPVLVTLAWLGVLAMTVLSGHHPIWDLEARNLAESAAFRDAGAVVRLIDAGEDPNDPGELRAGIVSPAASTTVPIEAAAASREAGMVQLLLDSGASPNASSWQRAWCISKAQDVRDLLALHRPEGAVGKCSNP
jgi:hypothetical protein